MAHAFIHAPDDDRHRRSRRERDVAERGQTEREGDRHRRKDHDRDEAHEEDQQIEVAERTQHRREL